MSLGFPAVGGRVGNFPSRFFWEHFFFFNFNVVLQCNEFAVSAILNG